MCRIQFVATTLAVFCLAGFCLPAATPAFGQQPQDAAAQLGPLEILDDCIQAAEKRDFQRYVDHLAPDEHRVQAAYALQAISTMSQSFAYGASAGDPNMLLLSRALSDLLRRHIVPVEQRDENHSEAERALSEMPGATYGIAVRPAAPDRYPAYPATSAPGTSYLATNQRMNREAYRKAAGILEDPRQFLVAVLAEAAQTATISGEQSDEVENTFDFDEVVKAYRQLKWTLYTRGDHALAVSHALPADERATQLRVPNQLSVPPASDVVALRVEFKRIDGAWKIDNLIQLLPFRVGGGLASFPSYSTEARVDAPRFNPYYASPVAP